MPAPNSVTLTVSFDLELEIGRATPSQLQMLDELTPDLVDLLDGLGIPTTFGLADPGRSAATEAILASHLPHEIAVLGDRSWLGWGAGGQRASRELARRISGAAERHIAVRSLVLRNESSFTHGMPLMELGIRTIRQPIGHTVLRPVSLTGISKGMKVAEQVQRLVLPNWWNWWDAESLRCHFSRRCLRSDRVAYHFGLDAQQLCSAGPRGLSRLATVLSDLADLRDQNGLRLQTLQGWNSPQSECRAA